MRPEVLAYVQGTVAPLVLGGRALDCCVGDRPYDLGLPQCCFETHDQVSFERGPDHVCDVHQLASLKDECYHLVTCLEALEHIERPIEAICAIRRVLRSHGIAVFTTVMDFPIHRHPHDFWRFTPEGLAILLDGFEILDFTIEGRREKPQGIWVTARKVSGDWRQHNLSRALQPHRVNNALTRWFAFKEQLHYRIARRFFGTKASPPKQRY